MIFLALGKVSLKNRDDFRNKWDEFGSEVDDIRKEILKKHNIGGDEYHRLLGESSGSNFNKESIEKIQQIYDETQKVIESKQEGKSKKAKGKSVDSANSLNQQRF